MTRPNISATWFYFINSSIRLFRHCRGVSALAVLVIFICSHSAWADAPATQPTDDTPQGFLAQMTNDRIAAMSVDQATATMGFNQDSDKDKASAKAMATAAIATAKLEVAVGAKWGKDAETAVAHICQDDTVDDDAKAKWTINGDHATATFAVDNVGPVMLVKQDGHWKLDLAQYRAADADSFDKDAMADAAVVDQLIADISKTGAYPTADAFNKHVKDALDKLNGN
jgi:hypothetical protein